MPNALAAGRKLIVYYGGAVPLAERSAGHADRAPMRAGHPETWGAITRGGVLDGVPYVYRDPLAAALLRRS